MRDNEIVGLWEAYLQVHQPKEEVEQLDEFLGSDTQKFVDKATKGVQSGLEKLGLPINRTPKGTTTQKQQQEKIKPIKPVGEEVEKLDELSSKVISGANHKRLQNFSAAERAEMRARNAGASMGEISSLAANTSAAAAKVSKHRELSTKHARSRKRMKDAGQNVNDSYEYEVENWVNSLIDEGYDLSEYTWEDMYEMYVNLDEGYDTFDTILEYLVAEGYADTNESALVIMANMSEEWRQSIVEEEKPYPEEKVNAKIQKVKKKEEIAIHQRKPQEADKQYKRSIALRFKKKMSDIGR